MSPRPRMVRVRKAQIRAAAAELIGERGLAATRIEDIAIRAGTSKAAVLYWFNDKDALLADALALEDEAFYGELTRRMAALDTAAARLRLLLDTFISSYDYRLWMEICLRSLRDEGTAAIRAQLDTRWRAMIAQTIADGQERGEFAPGDPADLAVSLAALLDGLSVQLALEDPDVPHERAARIWLQAAELWLGTPLGPQHSEPVDAAAAAAARLDT